MSIKVDKSYVITISEKPSSKLKPINAEKFMTALEGIYGVSKVKDTVRWIFNSENKFSGMKAFIDRFTNALASSGEDLLADDQKYLADIAFRYYHGQIRPVQL
jgi:hypothetical protein